MSELNSHAAFVLALIVFALLLFATERIRLQATALLTLLMLVVGFTVFPYTPDGGGTFDAASLLQVFGNEALIAVCALMILGKGVEITEALEPLVGLVSRNWSLRPRLTLLGVLVGAALASAFLNNTPIVVILLPVLAAIAQKNRTSPSKLLMPLGLVTIIGGMFTTIGTSTNLLVVDLAESIASFEIAMFDLVPLMAVAGALGIAYLWLIAPAITPTRDGEEGPVDVEEREYIATIVIDEGSPLGADSTVADLLRRTEHSISIDRIQHEGDTYRRPLPSVQLHPGDNIYVRGTSRGLKEAERILKTTMRTLDARAAFDPELEHQMMEILVTERSELDGISLRRSKLFEDYGVVAVALHRPEKRQERSKLPLNRIRLAPRDILLCEGTKEQFERLLSNTRLLALTDSRELNLTKRSSIALAIVAGVVALAAFELLPISIAALLGVGAMRATKCIAWRHIGQALSTQIILVIVVSLALGQALMLTGGDAFIAGILAEGLKDVDPGICVAALMLIVAALTNVVSNNAAAIIGTPIGIELATQLGIPVAPMIFAVLFGANLSFATPISYQTNLLVFTAGRYKFADFIRVGLPLTLIMWVSLSATLVWFYL